MRRVSINRSTYAGEPITVTDIVQYHYCPRKIYFIRTLGIKQQTRAKMAAGTSEHNKDKKRSSERKGLYGLPRELVKEVLRKKSLTDPDLGLTGLIDVVLVMTDDELLPVEAKFTDLPYVQRQWRKQLTAYAMLLEAEYKKQVTRGLLYFILQKKCEIIDIGNDDKDALKRDIITIRELIGSEKIPHKVDESKCGYCEMKKYCG